VSPTFECAFHLPEAQAMLTVREQTERTAQIARAKAPIGGEFR